MIAQQWQFTYRYPQYGGVETFSLVLPVGRTVEFHVTSLDVIHSFWAYQLGVKADAVPGADNIAFTTPKKVGLFEVRCAELCGLWHGYMYAHGHVVSPGGVPHLDPRSAAAQRPVAALPAQVRRTSTTPTRLREADERDRHPHPAAAASPPAATACCSSTSCGASSGSWSATRSASGSAIASAWRFDWVAAIDYNDIAILLGYVLGTVGYLAGLGILNHPIARMFGRSGGDLTKTKTGWSRYLRASTDHKVIGNQYLIGIGIFFFLGGVNAMLIRTELLQPNSPMFSPGQYLTIVGLHGAMMIMMVSSIILGPFGHFFVPLMIGSRRMAFPRMEALSFWLLPLAGVILMSTIAYGGFPTGWTGYPRWRARPTRAWTATWSRSASSGSA